MAVSVIKTATYQGHRDSIFTLCDHPDSSRFFAAGSEKLVVEWEMGKPDGVSILLTDAAIYSLLFVPGWDLLIAGLNNGGLQFYDFHNRVLAKAVKFHRDAIFDLTIHPDRDSILASSGDGSISRWDLKTLANTDWKQITSKSIRTMTLSPDGDHILLGASDNHIRILDKEFNTVQVMDDHYLSVFRIKFSPETGLLYSVGRDAHLRIWDPKRKFEQIEAIPAHMYAINDIVFIPGTTLMATGSMDKTIKIWDQTNFELLKVIDVEKHGCHKNGVNRLLAMEKKLISCGDDKLIMEWEVTDDA